MNRPGRFSTASSVSTAGLKEDEVGDTSLANVELKAGAESATLTTTLDARKETCLALVYFTVFGLYLGFAIANTSRLPTVMPTYAWLETSVNNTCSFGLRDTQPIAIGIVSEEPYSYYHYSWWYGPMSIYFLFLAIQLGSVFSNWKWDSANRMTKIGLEVTEDLLDDFAKGDGKREKEKSKKGDRLKAVVTNLRRIPPFVIMSTVIVLIGSAFWPVFFYRYGHQFRSQKYGFIAGNMTFAISYTIYGFFFHIRKQQKIRNGVAAWTAFFIATSAFVVYLLTIATIIFTQEGYINNQITTADSTYSPMVVYSISSSNTRNYAAAATNDLALALYIGKGVVIASVVLNSIRCIQVFLLLLTTEWEGVIAYASETDGSFGLNIVWYLSYTCELLEHMMWPCVLYAIEDLYLRRFQYCGKTKI